MFTQDDLIYTYSRRQAIQDGFQVLANSQITKEAGIITPVYLTIGVEALLQKGDYDGRLWDVLSILRLAARGAKERRLVTFIVKIGRKNVQLLAEVGAVDIDDSNPAITIMLPDER